ncbi:hypothetical protein [Sulfurimonas sp.]|uniref:hypothetical protein n=1 Tax=Sulfurimonas sp. TaxID=2022749 RepID=UPI0035654E85
MELQKAGSGLPNIERLFIKNILVPLTSNIFTWNSALYMYKKEIQKITKLIISLEDKALQQKTIIDRTFAIEDHSRQFSVNMVLEHLTITGYGIMSVIDTLSKEKEFEKEITVEGVKPFENKQNSLKDLLAFSHKYENFINNLSKEQSIATKKHPWFIEFNNFQWSVFMFMHTFIHRRQIKAIVAQLEREKIV